MKAGWRRQLFYAWLQQYGLPAQASPDYAGPDQGRMTEPAMGTGPAREAKHAMPVSSGFHKPRF